MNKKANLAMNWVEYLLIFLAVFGLFLSLIIDNVLFAYAIISICGYLCGHFMYKIRKQLPLHYYILVIGFLIGYVLGSYYASRKVIVLLFILGNAIGYYLHQKGIVS